MFYNKLLTLSNPSSQQPYFHRNVASEFMGLVRGRYDAKASGFDPGGASLHVTMTPHGPDTETFERAVRPESDAAPARLPDDSLAFMFELGFTPRVTPWALAAPELDANYYECWQGLRSHFDPAWRPEGGGEDGAPAPAAG